jgi:NADP-dependent aldehyde dehydrogenase
MAPTPRRRRCRRRSWSLVAHPAIKAVGFTGSLSGGKALLQIINGRDEPIPFYGELSSINPVIVTASAAAERAADIGAGLVGSITVGSGQLCTKPGLVLVPSGADGDRLVAAARAAVAEAAPQVLLNERIFTSYSEQTAALGLRGAVTTAATGQPGEEGFTVASKLFETTVDDVRPGLVDEIFGPVTVVVRYDAADAVADVRRTLDALTPSLTATLHVGAQDSGLASELVDVVRPRAGRIIFNGFPTGVAVSYAQTHGGPWPSTNSLHTSVGATAIRRFLRPVTYQDAPESVLPQELRDDYTAIPRRVDGVLQAGR